MGIDVNHAGLLLYARSLGVSFQRTATLGRQSLQITPEQLGRSLTDFGLPTTAQEAADLLQASPGYAESFLAKLGAEELVTFDASDFEKASYLHDFNLPIGDELKSRFTCVLDGGTLEHIFNFPVAIKNCMEMLEVGGHFLAITPTNNFPGHGLYQFSPELFFRVFCPANGFEMVKVVLYEDVPGSQWYEVSDPEAVKYRVTFVNTAPSYLGIIARRTHATAVFASYPQQSDYAALWSSGRSWSNPAGSSANPRVGLLGKMMAKVRNYSSALAFLCRTAGRYRKYGGFGYNPPFFKAIAVPGPKPGANGHHE
jgi:hypothetical protein